MLTIDTIQGGQKSTSRALNWYIEPPCSCQIDRIMDCQSGTSQIHTFFPICLNYEITHLLDRLTVDTIHSGQKSTSRALNWYIEPPCSCQNDRVIDCQSRTCQFHNLFQSAYIIN